MLTWHNILPFSLWSILKNRNQNTFNNMTNQPTLNQVYDETLEYISLISPNRQSHHSVDINIRWVRPKLGCYILNTDGTCKGNPGMRVLWGDPFHQW